MVVIVNGREIETAARMLADLVSEQSLGDVKIATAVNGKFVPATRRSETPIAPGDRIEIVSPRQGG
jgi:sulfur carrier protein